MPALSNPRHERYAQAFFAGLGNGITQHEAYKQAGYTVRNYSATKACASRLMRTIANRVAELQREQTERLERKLDLSKERVGKRLDLASRMAEQQENPNALGTIETSIAKVFGHITDKTEATITNTTPIPQTSEAIAVHLLADVGLTSPDAAAQERALAAYDTMVATLERIRDDSLGLSAH
jgi:hypothetical protein